MTVAPSAADELSVIVPMYNAQEFLAGGLSTIRANAEDGIHFYLVDDHSTDDTPRLVEAAVREMPYATFWRNDENFGVAKTRNLALEQVRSRYVTYFDIDDWYQPGHLSRLLAAIKDLGVDMVRTDHVRVRDGVRTLRRSPEEERGVAHPGVRGIGGAGVTAQVNYPYLWAGIYDLTAVDRALFAFDEHLRTAADRPWFWRMHLAIDSYAVVDLDGYFYRKDSNATALTQTASLNALCFTDAYHLVLDTVFELGNRDFILKAAADSAQICAWHITDQYARYSPGLREELVARAAGLLGRIPEDVLEESLTLMGRSFVFKRLVRRLWRGGQRQVEAVG